MCSCSAMVSTRGFQPRNEGSIPFGSTKEKEMGKMDKLTAERSFGNAGFSPAKGVKIYNKRFYAVMMQNVERDSLTDYKGLGDGEYVEILPGRATRDRRDAHLNHCNAIAEYTGQVYMVRRASFGYGLKDGKLVASVGEANSLVREHEAESAKHITACREEALKYRLRANKESIIEKAKKTGVGIARIDDPAFIEEVITDLMQWANDSDSAADKEEANPSFRATIEEVTGKAEYAAQFVRY